MVKSNTMKRVRSQGRLVLKLRHENEYLQRVSIARGKFVSNFKKPIKEGVEKFYTDLNRKKFKEMITTELEDELTYRWDNKYWKMINSETTVHGWVFSKADPSPNARFDKDRRRRYYTCSKKQFIKEYKKTYGRMRYKIDKFRFKRKIRTLLYRKNRLKHIKKSFSNDNFIAYNNPYVQYKISEKDKELKRLTNEKDKEIKRLKQELKKKEEKEESVKSRIDDMKYTYQLWHCRSGKLVDRYKKLRRVADMPSKYR